MKTVLKLSVWILLGSIVLCSCKEENKLNPPSPNDNAFIAGEWKLKTHIIHRNVSGTASDLDDTNSLYILIPCLKGTTFVFKSEGIFKFSDDCDWTGAGFYTNEPFTLSVDHAILQVTDKDKSIHKFKVELNGNKMTLVDGDDIQANKLLFEKI